MSEEELREAWLRFRHEAVIDAIGSKQVTDALLELFRAYENLSADERPIIDQLLIAQLGSGLSSARFDALALIRTFRILSAVDALGLLERHLAREKGPSARDERAVVKHLLNELSDSRSNADDSGEGVD